MWDLGEIIWRGGFGALDGDFAFKQDVAGRRADIDLIRAGLDFELLGLDIEITEGIFVEGDADFYFLARFNRDFLKALKFVLGTEDEGILQADVELGDFLAIAASDVLDFEGDALVVDLEAALLVFGIA